MGRLLELGGGVKAMFDCLKVPASQTLTESTLLAVLGAAAGLLLARLGTHLLIAAKPAVLAHLNGISMDPRGPHVWSHVVDINRPDVRPGSGLERL